MLYIKPSQKYKENLTINDEEITVKIYHEITIGSKKYYLGKIGFQYFLAIIPARDNLLDYIQNSKTQDANFRTNLSIQDLQYEFELRIRRDIDYMRDLENYGCKQISRSLPDELQSIISDGEKCVTDYINNNPKYIYPYVMKDFLIIIYKDKIYKINSSIIGSHAQLIDCFYDHLIPIFKELDDVDLIYYSHGFLD